MIQIPEYYVKNINRMFGNEGKAWVENIPDILNKYMGKFKLTQLKIIDKLCVNFVLMAKSEIYGDVMLKIGIPGSDIQREITALLLYNGKYVCKCYEYDREDRIILLERLLPGTSLHKVQNRKEKVEIFIDLMNKVLIRRVKDKVINLPEYKDVLNRASKYVIYNYSEKYPDFIELIRLADEKYKEIQKLILPKYIIHADLHHDNILLHCDKRIAIDPHGLFGEKVIETTRFIKNEIRKDKDLKSGIIEVVELISTKIDEPKELIYKMLFIDFVLSTCWSIEDNVEEKAILEQMKKCEIALELLNENSNY